MMSESPNTSPTRLWKRKKSWFLCNPLPLTLWMLHAWLTNYPVATADLPLPSIKANQCPVECACLGNVVDCSRLQLVGTPSGLPPWTEILDISGNRLGDNFTTALMELTQLQGLKINKNQLTRIPDLPFLKNLSQLSLNLNSNQIGTIEAGSLDNLTSLEELRLNKNRLRQLKDLFTNLGRLRILELNRNELQQIHGLSLKNLTSLEELRLKRNKIDTLYDGAFWPLKSLVLLQLDFNELSVVKKGGLFGLEGLLKLTLSHNRISTIEAQAWDICHKITELDLSYNDLASIERGTFEFLGKLEKLKMDHNKITYISDGAFNNTPNLQVLELNSNKISYMVEDINGAFVPLARLLKLGLAHNRIKSINKNAFTGLIRLTELDLTGNNITSIQDNALASMAGLVTLKMNSGSLVCDCGLQWLSVWLRDHRYSGAGIRCGYPHWLQSMPLTDLHHTNFTCDEYPKPRIIEEPVSQMSIKGENVTLICRATSTANAPLTFIWKHDNVELKDMKLQSDNGSANRGVTDVSSELRLINVTHAAAGRYQCMVSNTYGTTYSAKAKISVLVYPSFSKIPHDIRVPAGSTARLECSAEGKPSPQIAWQKDGGNDFPAARERRMHMMPTDDVLFIVNVKIADSGVYSCTAQNLAGIIVASATLTILETPSFVKPMENKEITVGGSIVLECMASGSPRPKLSWRKNGSPLQATERHFFTAEDQLLIIVDTIASDAGTYECEMSNSLGSVVGASHLTITPAPSPVVNEDDMLGLIIITVVCCAVGTSIVWVVIIYQTRRRLNATHNGTPRTSSHVNSNSSSSRQLAAGILPNGPAEAQTQLYLDTSSQHSKDSGTGDSTNPSSDQLQLCLPEEIVNCAASANGHEDDGAITCATDDDGLISRLPDTYGTDDSRTAGNASDPVDSGDVGDTNGGTHPLLRYTNHERNLRRGTLHFDCTP
ncbi:leucine-rich repeats and immunoglobulin-like domains protein 3 isoform X2 [Cephus cinctus]|uniref:Leucine-rich repeats and immunoglobulin-like domains protein 3 isoform X2 n=1 Tax=Cephus cinctus TaxID=211228 RepID=A0AAJ7RHG0_CEPCN|nr:leucine-rich repeats and immunoglobulin-like domains protein 3 isoform X2 [Cephus cinctus]